MNPPNPYKGMYDNDDSMAYINLMESSSQTWDSMVKRNLFKVESSSSIALRTGTSFSHAQLMLLRYGVFTSNFYMLAQQRIS